MSEEDTPTAGVEKGSESPAPPVRVLLVEDEERFRTSLAERLRLRGYEVAEARDGEEGIRRVRLERPDVVLLDRKMPKISGEEALKEMKRIAPEVQVVILTGHASFDSATETGRLEAFAYLEKPCETPELVSTIEAAYREKRYALARLDMARVESPSVLGWLWGTQNFRPGIMMLGAVLFAALYFMPAPGNLIRLLSTPKTGSLEDPIAGHATYGKMKTGDTIADDYGRTAEKLGKAKGDAAPPRMAPDDAAKSAQAMVGVLVVAALFWATGALPIGITALLVGVLMYFFQVFPPNKVAQAYAKDAVIFIMGVLGLAAGIAKTGLDRRIGLLLLGTSRSIRGYLFIFCPLLAVCASFLSEHALVAFLAPLLMVVYLGAIRAAGLQSDRSLAVVLMLALTFVANQGGPGSPAAGGRNAIMVGILSDYGADPSFGEWVLYGLPFVPVMALVTGAYFYLYFRRKIHCENLDIAAMVRAESKKLGRMTREEYLTAAVLVLVIVLWITASNTLGMGGPVLLGLVALAALRVIGWRQINSIHWDVVALYASASAIGVGLSSTGAAMWIAAEFVDVLPDALRSGEGLAVASSGFTGVLTNFMSDGATVSAIGPITVPMAELSGTNPLMVGLATAFASSFANCLIIGTPNNAIAYSLARDPRTGEQLLTLGDFLKHGLIVTLLSFAVLWGWVIFGYWQWIGF